MAGFLFRLETPDGAPAEPPTFDTATPNWRPGDVIPLGKRTLRVIGKRDNDADQPPVLIVEEGIYGLCTRLAEAARLWLSGGKRDHPRRP
jgi:hypothetical protein